jgi:ssDNA-specific exonuclease RecJ
MLSYLLKEYNLEKNRVENEMKFRFNNLEELKDYLNKKEE